MGCTPGAISRYQHLNYTHEEILDKASYHTTVTLYVSKATDIKKALPRDHYYRKLDTLKKAEKKYDRVDLGNKCKYTLRVPEKLAARSTRDEINRPETKRGKNWVHFCRVILQRRRETIEDKRQLMMTSGPLGKYEEDDDDFGDPEKSHLPISRTLPHGRIRRHEEALPLLQPTPTGKRTISGDVAYTPGTSTAGLTIVKVIYDEDKVTKSPYLADWQNKFPNADVTKWEMNHDRPSTIFIGNKQQEARLSDKVQNKLNKKAAQNDNAQTHRHQPQRRQRNTRSKQHTIAKALKRTSEELVTRFTDTERKYNDELMARFTEALNNHSDKIMVLVDQKCKAIGHMIKDLDNAIGEIMTDLLEESQRQADNINYFFIFIF
ncbi:unnamed protein product [Fusarium graminearum]|nr:unnamed protein product [Fusarium graminearum]